MRFSKDVRFWYIIPSVGQKLFFVIVIWFALKRVYLTTIIYIELSVVTLSRLWYIIVYGTDAPNSCVVWAYDNEDFPPHLRQYRIYFDEICGIYSPSVMINFCLYHKNGCIQWTLSSKIVFNISWELVIYANSWVVSYYRRGICLISSLKNILNLSCTEGNFLKTN